MHCEQPFIQRNFGALHGGADGHCELPSAFTTMTQSGPVRFAAQSLDSGLVDVAAMRTAHTMWPALGFEPFTGLVGILKAGIAEVQGLCPLNSRLTGGFTWTTMRSGKS